MLRKPQEEANKTFALVAAGEATPVAGGVHLNAVPRHKSPLCLTRRPPIIV